MVGAGLMITAALMFGLMGAGVKTASEELPQAMVVFGRNAFGLIALLPWILAKPVRALKTHRLRMHLLRAAFGLSAMYCFFYTISQLPLSNAFLLQMCAPLFIPVIAHFWLQETVSRTVVLALVLGFLGTALVLRPDADSFSPASVTGIACAVFIALALTSARKLTDTESTTSIVFYFALLATGVSLLPALLVWVPPEPMQWLLLIGLGVFATLGQLLMTRAYALAPAALIGVFQYTNIIFAGLLGWMFWSETPDAPTVIGGILICTAGIMASGVGRWLRQRTMGL